MKSRLWTWGGLALSALVFAGVALAQDDATPRRIDPGDTPPPATGELPAPWAIIDVTGQTPRTTLGKLAVDAWGGVYVWSVQVVPIPWRAATPMTADDPTPRRELPDPAAGIGTAVPGNGDAMLPLPRRADPGEPPFPDEGIGPPLLPTLYTTVSTLYYYNAGVLSADFQVSGETGVSIFVAKSGDVFAATELEDGTLHAYRRHAGVWLQDDLPAGVHAPAGELAGGNTVFFRAGDRVLRHTGEHWKEEISCEGLASTGALVYLGRDQVMATCDCGRHVFDGTVWTEDLDPAEPHVHAAWGGRDAMGELHLFTAGCNAAHTELQIEQFVEDVPGALQGKFELVADDLTGVESDPGTAGLAVWGRTVHDIYLSGVIDRTGHLYQFDGARWSNITPLPGLPTMVDVAGTPWGELWVSLVDGRLLHRQAGEVPIDPLADPILPVVSTPGPMATDTPLLRVSRDAAGMQTARFELAGPGPVTVEVFDLAGRVVATLENGTLPAGTYQRSWDASRAPSGVYFCRVRAGAVQMTQKMLVHR